MQLFSIWVRLSAFLWAKVVIFKLPVKKSQSFARATIECLQCNQNVHIGVDHWPTALLAMA